MNYLSIESRSSFADIRQDYKYRFILSELATLS